MVYKPNFFHFWAASKTLRIIGVADTSSFPKGLNEEEMFEGESKNEQSKSHSCKARVCDVRVQEPKSWVNQDVPMTTSMVKEHTRNNSPSSKAKVRVSGWYLNQNP